MSTRGTGVHVPDASLPVRLARRLAVVVRRRARRLGRGARRLAREIRKRARRASRPVRGLALFAVAPLIRTHRWLEERSAPPPAPPQTAFEAALITALKRLRIDCVVDAGAGTGEYARLLRRLGFRGRIVSFEPVAASHAALAVACRGDRRWSCQRLALGERRATAKLRVTRAPGLSSFLRPGEFAREIFADAAAVVDEQEVEVHRLDELLDEVAPGASRILLKMHTQGREPQVFRGAEGCLDRVVAVQPELPIRKLHEGMPDYPEALELFRRAGFELGAAEPLFRDDSGLLVGALDCLLIRPEDAGRVARTRRPPRRAAPLGSRPQLPPLPPAAGRTPEDPWISVLVTTCGDGEMLRACLARVGEQAASLDAEVVLAVNATEDSLPPGAEQELSWLCDRIVFEPCVGKSHAINRAIAACRGEVVAFTDDDAVPEPGWLEAITAPLLRVDRPVEVVGCGGPVLPEYRHPPPEWYERLVEGRTTNHLGPRHDLGNEPIDYTPPFPGRSATAPLGVNCAFRREVFARYRYDPELGPNRETGLRGGEDFELGFRLLLDGYRLLYRPEARVRHPVTRERMDPEFVRRAQYANGLEWSRLARRLGLPTPTAEEVRASVSRTEAGLRSWLPSGRTIRKTRRLELEWQRGQADELERGPRAPTAPGVQDPRSDEG